jgi:cyclopropane fatty-acyl-phospholipid synthase-like methyltransferase
MGVRERIELIGGDYGADRWPTAFDAVLMSGIFHRESPEGCRRLLQNARRSLLPGGMVVVADVLTDAGGATPAFAALFGLNMFLSAPDGGVHADADVMEWMRAAGFHPVETRPFPPPMPHRVVLGWKAE